MEPRPQSTVDPDLFDEDESEVAVSQEFDRALALGSQALQKGDSAAARTLLEKALRYKPRNQRARNLLGLALFKLGELDKAEAIYRGLIEDHPADPTLRVNLGLVFLKAGASSDAVRCFETTLDLAPDHRKAQNYLGLALAQKGELARAREWFYKAGNAAMAEKMTQQLASSPIRDVADDAEQTLESVQPFHSALEAGALAEATSAELAQAPQAPEDEPAARASQWVATTPAELTAPPPLEEAYLERPEFAEATPVGEEPADAGPPEAQATDEALAAPQAGPADARADGAFAEGAPESPSALSAYTSARRLAVPQSEGGFGIGATEVLIEVRGEVLTRMDGLVASWGSLSMKPELKRFRGKATDKPFGEGARRMLRATGEGRLVISREGRQFTALELGDEPAYFREEVLFAIEESILFENGRVPAKSGPDLHLVHVRGRGRILLVTAGVPKAVDVTRGEPLRIPMDQLVGWHGPLIQPRLVPIVEEAPELGVALELAGEGRALVDAPDGR